MGQTHLWPPIGPIRVPRPVPGLIFHETDTRNLMFGVPGTLGAKFGDLGVGGSGAHVCYNFPRKSLAGTTKSVAAAFTAESRARMT